LQEMSSLPTLAHSHTRFGIDDSPLTLMEHRMRGA